MVNRATSRVEVGRQNLEPERLSSEDSKHNFIEKASQVAASVKYRRRSFTSRILHPRRCNFSVNSNKLIPILPLELIEKVITYLDQYDLVKFSRVSRDCYTICEKYIYRRPFTRRFDKLLRTLQKYPYKGEMILELALGLETDFFAVKYLLSPRAI